MSDTTGISHSTRFGMVSVRKYAKDVVEANHCDEFAPSAEPT